MSDFIPPFPPRLAKPPPIWRRLQIARHNFLEMWEEIAFDLEFSQPPSVDLTERLNAVLPQGLRVLASRPILFKTPSLMSQLGGGSYRIRFPRPYLADAGLTPGALRAVLAAAIPVLLARDHVIVRRTSEGQTREFDARPSVAALELSDEETPVALDAHIRFTARAQARPEEVVALLVPNADPRITDVERVMLWAESDGRRLDPLALLGAGD